MLPVLLPGRWALTPPFHPCLTNQLVRALSPGLFSKTSRRFPCAMPPCCSAGGLFSVALSVTEPHRAELSSTPPAEARNSTLQRSLRGRPLALPGALPYFVTGSREPTTTVSGLSSRPDCSRPAITRPVRQFHYSSNLPGDKWRVASYGPGGKEHAPRHASESADHSGRSCGAGSFWSFLPARRSKSVRLDFGKYPWALPRAGKIQIRLAALCRIQMGYGGACRSRSSNPQNKEAFFRGPSLPQDKLNPVLLCF
jgi:hypothetical protein